MCNQNIIAQPGGTFPDNPDPDTIMCNEDPCPCEVLGTCCDIWAITQQIDWSPPIINTNGTLNLGGQFYPTSASQVFTSGQVISNKEIHIHYGFFKIDIPLTFSNCEIILEPSATVIITGLGSYTVKVKDTYLHGTNALWYGFDIYEGKTIIMDNCYVEDAYTAIIGRSGSTIRSVDTKYNKNLVSIRCTNSREDYYGSPQVVLNENHFNCTGNLLPVGPWIEGFFNFPPQNTSYAAIYSTNTNLVLDEYYCNFSSIGNHANGILSFGGDVTAANYLFYNIRGSSQYQYPYEGYGIAINLDEINNYNSNGNFLNTNGWDTNEITDPNFRNVDYPLTLIGGYLNARFHRTMNSITSVRGTRITQLEVITNEFDYSSRGVFWWNSHLPEKREAEISLSTFTGTPGSIGVYSFLNVGNIFQPDLAYYYSYNIHSDTFIGNSITGIVSMQDRTAKFYNNKISLTGINQDDVYGIRVSGGYDIITKGNDVKSIYPPPGYGVGIEYVETDASLIRCNDVKYWGKGFHWVGTNHLQIRGNDAIENDTCWVYEESSSTDVQKYADNRWYPIASQPVKAWHKDGFYSMAVHNSSIIVGSNTQAFSTNWHPGRPVPPVPNSLDSEIGVYYPRQNCTIKKDFPMVLSQADSLIAIGNMQGTSFPIAYQWMLELDLYTKIQDNQMTFPPSSVYYTFLQQCQNNNISDFYQAIKDFYNSFDYTSQQSTDIENLQVALKTTYNFISYYDSLYNEGAISFPTLMQHRQNLYQTVNIKRDALDNVIDAYQQDRNSDLSAAITTFQNISTSNYLAAVYKNAYQLYAKYYLGQLTSQDTARIFNFDGACIEEYHDAALIYQVLSEAIGQKNNLIAGCDSHPQIRSKDSENTFQLFPNPAKNYLSIHFKRSYTGDIRILDITGQTVKKITLRDQLSKKIDIANLMQGLYIIKIEKGNYEPVKFIKQ